MAEIRCQMCGKPNPEELDVCQFCQARLKPLRIDPSQQEDSDTLPYWLNTSPEDEPEKEVTSPEEGVEEPQDWLDQIRAESEIEDASFQEIESEPLPDDEESVEADEDWIQRFRSLQDGDQAPEAESIEAQPEGEFPSEISSEPILEEDSLGEDEMGVPDWLDRLQEDAGAVDSDSPISGDEEPASEGELPDWISEAPTGETEPEPVIEGMEEESSDWLSELGIEGEAEVPEEAEPALEGELPDWVPEAPTGETEPEPVIEGEGEEIPDWLSELGIEGEAEVPEEAEPALEGELPDWVPEAPTGEPEAELALEGMEEEPSDWLSELGIEGEAGVPEEAEPALEGELPDWVPEAPTGEPEAEPALEGMEEEPSDWLSELGIEGEAGVPEEAEPTLEGELPDWVPEAPTGEPEAEPVLEGEDEEPPDWLSELGIEGEVEVPEEAEPTLEGELLDWVPEAPTDETEAELEQESQAEETPEWLTELSIAYDKAAQEEAEPSIEGELPEWLSGIAPDEIDVEAELVEEIGEIPDWLSDLDTRAGHPAIEDEIEPKWPVEPEEEELEVVQGPSRPGDQFPEWLSESGEAIESDREEIPDLLSVPGQDLDIVSGEDEDLQGWLSELESDTALSGEPTPSSAFADTGEDIPSWLKNLGSVVTGSIEEGDTADVKESGISPFVGQDEFEEDLIDAEGLPEWLSPETESAEDREPTDESDLTPAELPGWLAAMRPVDVKKPKIPLDEGRVESAGPLAGLRSVLPAEPEITHFKKPPVYSSKLQVTGSQKAHADLFLEMLSIDEAVEPIPPSPLISPQHALRWLIAFILIISIGIFVIGGGEFLPLPGNAAIPDTTYAASKIISAIPNQAPVLLAFDYEPGITGEMNAAAAALVDHLMLKGARLTLVSTLPTGPALAEYFIQTVQNQHDYTPGLQYINLGYIPGGAAGLLSFAQTPEWIFPLSYNGMPPWETTPLEGVNSLSDFTLVVVITEDPEDARVWIEQVQPRIEGTPMLTVVSAQAEPLVRPYFRSDQNAQVSGIVSGLMGGAAYELAVGRTNLGRIYWDAFSVGLIIALGAIIVGGMVNVIQMILQRHKNNSRGERS
jgi:hypothetical protein